MKNKLKKVIIALITGALIFNICFIGSESDIMPCAEMVELEKPDN